ncbi:hypothetical protein CKO44_10180 [Rubrivivax gelatinosus]|uniref:Uncharacterized protein n=1 Tax=Rubrivivax gelatinosus TaxID=28068 RepID=A0ABS1DYR7_RUBGE|nr:hypothetical protein [Rubrivivax gelatinosus]MBK1613836.1 hypothetical protein [Rubrivivax gelatinosus]MBK1715237.1 hypothetical protein [Rubrivivax gelatinosus]
MNQPQQMPPAVLALARAEAAAGAAYAALLRRAEAAEADAMRLRALLIRRDTEIGQLRDEIHLLHVETPDLRTRLELVRENRRQADQLVVLRRALGGGWRPDARQRPAFGA